MCRLPRAREHWQLNCCGDESVAGDGNVKVRSLQQVVACIRHSLLSVRHGLHRDSMCMCFSPYNKEISTQKATLGTYNSQ